MSHSSFLNHVGKKFGQCVCLLCIACHVWHSCIIFPRNWALHPFVFIFSRHVDQNRTLLRIGAHSPRRELGAHPIRNPIRMPTRYFLRGEVTPDLRKLWNQEHGTIELHDKFHVIRRLRCSNVHKHPGECAYEHVGWLFAWVAYKRCRLCANRRVCSKAWECCTIEGEGEESGVSTCFDFSAGVFDWKNHRRVISGSTLCQKMISTWDATRPWTIWLRHMVNVFGKIHCFVRTRQQHPVVVSWIILKCLEFIIRAFFVVNQDWWHRMALCAPQW